MIARMFVVPAIWRVKASFTPLIYTWNFESERVCVEPFGWRGSSQRRLSPPLFKVGFWLVLVLMRWGVESVFWERAHVVIKSLMNGKKIVLYVQTVKSIGGTEEFQPSLAGNRIGGYGIGLDARAYKAGRAKYEYVLPSEQEAIVNEVRSICNSLGFDLEVVDVTREGILRRAVQEKIKKIDAFPALLSDSGRLIEGIESKEEARAFLHKESKPLF